ncbi:MAG: DNA methyltransferase, partial [Gemmatimonadales bacterium]
VRNYVGHLPDERPPYLLVLDVGKTLLVWDHWSGDFGGFNAARRIDLRKLADAPADVALLKAIWEDPASLDPRAKAARVTKEIAAKLAELATSLESRGHPQEVVAQFLIRIMFTMFAEDVDLLPGETLEHLLSDVPLEELPSALEDLWKAMDRGGRFGGRKLARFNGNFFEDPRALPLTAEDKTLLILAAQKEWQEVEPSIFGTLMVRALDPAERHRLGAEFTPREFVERLVRPTIEEPVRERWTLVQAQVLQLRESGKEKDRKAALKAVQDYHEWLCGLQILDPACGSGNFLYVTLHLLKRIELEVRALENELRKRGDADLRLFEIHPRQFHGIEVKPWAREIAELTLWIGYYQFWKQYEHVEHPEPILEDTATIECRDAVLAWDEIRHDPSRDRPDPTPRIPSPVTGELIPDPTAKLPYMEYVNPRPAEWPQADFIVGNPPYVGNKRMRDALGDGYVEAVRSAYPEVPGSADLVMFWWYRSGLAVAKGAVLSAGLITTNSIRQPFNRPVVSLVRESGGRIVWAIGDHPWTDEVDGAAVRVSLTV